jgi:hypothetical protein
MARRKDVLDNSSRYQYHDGPNPIKTPRPMREATLPTPDTSSLNTSETQTQAQTQVLLGQVIRAMLSQ